MEFNTPKSFKRIVRTSLIDGKKQIIKIESLSDENDHNLNFYLKPSTENISLLDFQELGKHRLNVLRKIESLKERFGSGRQEYFKEYQKEFRILMPLAVGNCPLNQIHEFRRKDRLSHFILRLAFSQSIELSNWFISQETELFRMRFQMEKLTEIMRFLNVNKIYLDEISSVEKSELSNVLAKAHSMSLESVMKTTFFKVDFDEVFELFFSYKLYLKNGIAYITSQQLLALIAPRFRENLASSMAYARRHLGQLQDEEERILPILRQFTKKGTAYKKEFMDSNVSDITPNMVDSLAKESFPLCMQSIHSRLRLDHHLRHFARRQYGLFLKGIGMSMESSLAFFREEFTKKMDHEKFGKEHAYNIRHIYGKEGSRKEGNPLTCPTIILGSAPAAQDCHGCPYRHSEPRDLAKKLENFGLKQEQINKILNLSKQHQYDKACAHYLEASHKMPEGGLGLAITHPNEYYSISRKILSGERALDTGTAFQQICFEI